MPIITDLLDEANETFFVNLSQPTNSILLDPQAVATIVDDDPQPTLSINSVSVSEGDLGTTDAVFTVTLSAVSGRDVTVAFATTGVTATSGADFQPTSGTLTFSSALNETAKLITVSVMGDLNVEANETFNVTLANAVNASITTGTGVGTIVDDEPRLSVADIQCTAREPIAGHAGGHCSTSPAAVLSPWNSPRWRVTATGNVDYVATSGTLTFQPGQTVALLDIGILNDVLNEDDETFQVNFFNAVGASILDGQALVTIDDDDPLPDSHGEQRLCHRGGLRHRQRRVQRHAQRTPAAGK